MKRKQLAINSVSTTHRDLVEAIEAYAAASFHNVEFVLSQVKDWLAQGHTIAAARRLLAMHNLRSIGGFEAAVECFTTPESQRANHDLLRTNAQLIHDLGGGTMVVGTDGPDQSLPDPLAGLDAIAATLGELAQSLEGLDVTIALEFTWSPVVRSLQNAVLVAQKVNHPQVGVLFDPAHYYTTPTKLEHLGAETVRWITHVHLDDMAAKPADLSDCNADRVLPGAGILDLHELIARLEHYGYSGFFSIEMFNRELWQLPAPEAARRCYQSLLPLCQ